MSLLRAAVFVVPLLAAALVRWGLARRDVRPGHRWLLWIPIAGSAIVAMRSQLAPRRRAAVILGAMAAAYLAAALCAFTLFITVGEYTGEARYVISAATPGGAAEGRLSPGDRLVALDGEPLFVLGGPPLSNRINAKGGRPLQFAVERGGRAVTVEITPRLAERGVYRIGVELMRESVFERPGVGAALAGAAAAPAEVSRGFISAAWHLLTARPPDDGVFMGPVGITDSLAKVTGTREALHGSLAVSVWLLTWAVLADLVLLLAVGVIAIRRRGGGASGAR